MAIHAMIDLETLDTQPSCVVLTLGGVKFNPFSNDEPFEEIYMKLDIDEQDSLQRTVTESTLAWWGKQDQSAQDAAFDPNGRISLLEATKKLNKWLVGVDVIWGHGYGFDLTILESVYRDTGVPIPWNFWQVQDSRTLFNLLPADPRKSMQTDLHNALADAYYQAKGVQIAFDALKIPKK